MSSRPRAREGLLAADHSKRGRRFVTIVDPATCQVTLLEPWEHSVLSLLRGDRDVPALVELLAPEIDGQPIDPPTLERCLRFFEKQRLIEPRDGARAAPHPPGPVTATVLRIAAVEWTPLAAATVERVLPPPLVGASSLTGLIAAESALPLSRGELLSAVDAAAEWLGLDGPTGPADAGSTPAPREATEPGGLVRPPRRAP